MENEEGDIVDIYIPRKCVVVPARVCSVCALTRCPPHRCSYTNRLIRAT